MASFEFDLEGNLLDLQDELCAQTYRPGAYTNFYIYEPKRRLVSAAPFRDRVVHHALCRVIEPIWDASPTRARFIDTSYACRVGKGTHAALDRCQAWMRKYAYAFHGDVVKYFPSIDHEILRGLVSRRIADKRTMWLVDRILDSGVGIQTGERPVIYFPQDDPSTGSGQGLFAALRPKGLPIGNLTSQFWANVYLHELDMFVKHQLRCCGYLRYMDDFVLFCDDKAQLQAWKAATRDFLTAELRLELHPRKSPVFPVGVGIDFCGFRIYPTHRRMGVADGDQEVDELDQQVIYLPVVGDAAVVCIRLPDKVRLAKSEQASQGLPDVTLLDQNVLAARGGPHAHLGTVDVAQTVQFVLRLLCVIKH